MPPATVPKTSVHEYSKLFAAEDKIRLSRKLLIPSPARNSARSENCNQPEFRVLVSLGLYCSHYLRTLNFVEYVGHTILCGSSYENCRTLAIPDKNQLSDFPAAQCQRPFEILEKLGLNQSVNENPIHHGTTE